MDRVTTITSKGQVTIPKAVRDALGLKPHDKIEFSVEEGVVRLRKANSPFQNTVGSVLACDVPMEEWDSRSG
ncbi:MAG: AbrB/MazE/SpoVT family DNA-binding domain-containing protein [Candidatus Binatia bacterium]